MAIKLKNPTEIKISKVYANSPNDCCLGSHIMMPRSIDRGFTVYQTGVILTEEFQSDPIERCSGQYRQISGGRFLISEKDINISEKILKIKELIKEGVEINSTVLSTGEDSTQVAKLMDNIDELVGETNGIQLNDDSSQVFVTVVTNEEVILTTSDN